MLSMKTPCKRNKKVAIVQSSYIPWKGYFDLINQVDEFILFDDVQYTRRDWRNRNLIKTTAGLKWITIPVIVKGKYHQKIREVIISDQKWAETHWKIISHTYGRAPYFKKYKQIFETLFSDCKETYLSEINYRFIKAICEILGIKTKFSWSTDYDLVAGKTERIVGICLQSGASEYLSGPSARSYLKSELFTSEKIHLRFADYSDYPPYHQMSPPFEHGVSIIDLIFNEGPNASRFMKSFKDAGRKEKIV